MLQFKAEMIMLLAAIVLFTVSTICYSYVLGDLATLSSYPYRTYALPIVSFASVLMATATVSYAKRSKNQP